MSKATCRWPECERPTHARGFCTRDYQRAKKAGDFDTPWVVDTSPASPCGWPGCEAVASTRGYCPKHYQRFRTLGFIESPWEAWASRHEKPVCRWPTCTRPAHCRGLCTRDYSRAVKVGDFAEPWRKWNPLRPCEWCGVEFQRHNVGARFCSPACSRASYVARNADHVAKRVAQWKAANRDRHRLKEQRRRARRAETQVASFSEVDVRMAHGDICYLCNKAIDFRLSWPHPQSPSLDHVVPLSRGGTHTLDNVAMTHLRCNVRKSANPPNAQPLATLLAL